MPGGMVKSFRNNSVRRRFTNVLNWNRIWCKGVYVQSYSYVSILYRYCGVWGYMLMSHFRTIGPAAGLFRRSISRARQVGKWNWMRQSLWYGHILLGGQDQKQLVNNIWAHRSSVLYIVVPTPPTSSGLGECCDRPDIPWRTSYLFLIIHKMRRIWGCRSQ